MATTTEQRGRMRLEISYLLAQEMIHSEFGTWTPAATEMHAALRAPEAVHDRGRGKIAVVRATPEAWDAMRRWCELHAFTDTKDNFEKGIKARSYLRYQQRLRKELDRLAANPAYRGLAVPGTCPIAFLGCRVDDGRWWPTIRQALDAVSEPGELERCELIPEQKLRRRQVFTIWNPTPLG